MTIETPAEHDRAVTTLDPYQTSAKQDLETALERAGRRAADAKQARAAAIAEIGELLRRDRAAGDLVGIVAAQSLTGLTRPTLTAAREDRAGWDEIAHLAKQVLTYGDDHGDQTELHAMRPWLGGLWGAMVWLQDQHAKAIDFNPLTDTFGPSAPGYDVLAELYYGIVRRLANYVPGACV